MVWLPNQPVWPARSSDYEKRGGSASQCAKVRVATLSSLTFYMLICSSIFLAFLVKVPIAGVIKLCFDKKPLSITLSPCPTSEPFQGQFNSCEHLTYWRYAAKWCWTNSILVLVCQDTMAEDATQASADGSLPALMPLFIFGFDVLSKYRINESMQA